MQLRNLLQLLQQTASSYPDHGLFFYAPGQLDAIATYVSYPELLQRTEQKAKLLQRLHLRPGSVVLLHFRNHIDNLEWFWAVTYVGLVPALSTPFTNNLEQRKKHILYLDTLLDHPLCLTSQELLPEFLEQDTLRVQTAESFLSNAGGVNGSEQRNGSDVPLDQGKSKHRSDIAALMLTSGSTGNAKAVCLTHGMMLSAIAGKSHTNATNTYTPFFNWIGADHVACITEIHLHAMWVGANQVHAQAADLIPDPPRFLQIINKHRVGYTFAPNFFLASLRTALEKPAAAEVRATLDLSSLHTIVSGGEANVVETCTALARILEEHGAPTNVVAPAFGMTETCAGSIYNKDCPDWDIEHQNEFASLGFCIPYMEMRITDQNGKEVDSGVPGNLEIRGPNIFSQYYNNSKATEESFNDGWLITGDRGVLHSSGHLDLTGRAKETLIINGINFLPQEIETVLEGTPGTKPSYTVVFPHRPKGSQTESLCIVYCPTYSADDTKSRLETNEAISRATLLQIGVRPYILPLDERMLQKTTLGKLSRVKIRTNFEKGDYRSYQDANDEAIQAHKTENYEAPTNETEEHILRIFQELFDFPDIKLGVADNLFALGVNSIDIIKVKHSLQVEMNLDVPVITIMTNPSIRSLAIALDHLKKPHVYDPVVVLQPNGTKTPLWLIHPGVGEILVFLSLASHLTDRPVYAMRARGFEAGEEYFSSTAEAVATYHARMKEVQPEGPYAIAGYSYGSMIAFEITKVLNSQGDAVPFLGVFNLPPHIKYRMRQLDWTNCLLNLSYFLDFFSEDYAVTMHPILQQQPRDEVLAHVLSVAPAARMKELGLDAQKLTNWADLAYAMQSNAVDYEPQGVVEQVDVFAAIPLASVANGMEDWKLNKLGKWRDFSASEPKVREVEGAHYTMIGPAHVNSFQKILKGAMAERGI